MTIYEQFKEILKNKVNQIILPADVKAELANQFGTNPNSIILSDNCYNRYNYGIRFDKHLFQYINRNAYKYLGEDYPFTGLIFQKPKGQDKEIIVGEWKNGVKTMYEKSMDDYNSTDNELQTVSKQQIIKLYEEYNEILRVEMNLLNCKLTELRHLIGKIGKFFCAIYTNGELSRQTNQHGFDVISHGRRIRGSADKSYAKSVFGNKKLIFPTLRNNQLFVIEL